MRQLLLQMSPEVSEKRMLVCSYTNNEEHGGERSSEGTSRGMVTPVQGVLFDFNIIAFSHPLTKAD
jgi:hypothetical protein